MTIRRRADANGDHHVHFDGTVRDTTTNEPAGSAKITGKFVSPGKAKLRVVHDEAGSPCMDQLDLTLKRF
jgi:hypothetical protein